MFDTLRAVINFKVGPSTLSCRHLGYGRVGEADEFIRTVAFAQYGRVFLSMLQSFPSKGLWLVLHRYSPRVFFVSVSQVLFWACEYCAAYWRFSTSSWHMLDWHVIAWDRHRRYLLVWERSRNAYALVWMQTHYFLWNSYIALSGQVSCHYISLMTYDSPEKEQKKWKELNITTQTVHKDKLEPAPYKIKHNCVTVPLLNQVSFLFSF